MVKQLGVIPQETPTCTQLQSQSSFMDPESPQVVDTLEGEISNSDQEGLVSGTPELKQLVLTVEEQLDYDSFPTPTCSVTKAPLWRFAEETPSGSKTQPKSQTATTQAQPITSNSAKPLGSQMQAAALA